MRNFKQNDDDCVSENSFGSDFCDNAADKEDLKTTRGWDTHIEPDLPPAYSEEEHPQSNMFLLANKSPPVVLQYTPPTSTELELESPFRENFSGQSTDSMCVVCKISPVYSKDGGFYSTCRSLTCASKMRSVPIASPNFLPQHRIPPSRTGIAPSSASPLPFGSQITMCDICHVRPRFQKAGKTYPTCGLTCAGAFKTAGPSSNEDVPTSNPTIKSYQSSHFQQPSQAYRRNGSDYDYQFQSLPGGKTVHTASTGQPCVVCLVNPCCDGRFVTCGMECTEALCRKGSANPEMCDYCHRRPKFASYNQCGRTCRDNARKACLFCRCRPKVGRYPFCGQTCKMIATKWAHAAPLILEARLGHTIYNEVEQWFKRAWKGNDVCPPIKKIYKIIENKSFLLPYDRYKEEVGNEVFRYHGTSRRCMLGSQGNNRLCFSTTCALCSVLRTSFKVSQSGAFGAGVYTSSTANKAYSLNGGKGAIIVTKVVLGTVYDAKTRHQVKSCPPGYNSVVFDPKNGKLDDTTVVYTDEAIRPVYLITF